MFKMQIRILALSFILIATLVAVNFYAITGLAQAQVVCAEDYVVQADDTLGALADRFLGDVLAYPAIFEATNAAGEGYEVYGQRRNPLLTEMFTNLKGGNYHEYWNDHSHRRVGPIVRRGWRLLLA